MGRRLIYDDEGVLTFEWILLLTLIVIGVIGGIAAIRDAIIHESQGVVGAMVSLDQGYEVTPPLGVSVDSLTPTGSGCTSSASFSSFRDSATWGNGRLGVGSVSAISQVYNPNNGLCPLP